MFCNFLNVLGGYLFLWWSSSHNFKLDVSQSLSHISGSGSNSIDLVEHYSKVYMIWCFLCRKSRKKGVPFNQRLLTLSVTIS